MRSSLSSHDRPPGATALQGEGPRLIVIDAPELAALPKTCLLRLIPAPHGLCRLTAGWIAESRAQAVLFALFAAQPDAWQICGHLTYAGFAGRVFAVSPVLPNRRLVERELRAEYPLLRLQVVPVLS